MGSIGYNSKILSYNGRSLGYNVFVEDTTVPLVNVDSSYDTWQSAMVNMHLGYTSTEGFDNDLYVQNAKDSGFNWFRDQITNDKGYTSGPRRRHREIAAAGGKWAMVGGKPTGEVHWGTLGNWITNWRSILDHYGGMIDVLMGPNEYLGSSATDTNRANLRDYMREIASTLEAQSEPLAAKLRADLWAPSQAFSDRQDKYTLNFNDGVSTRGDMHSYPGGITPVGENGSGSFWSWKTSALKAVPNVDPVATETGYHSAYNGNGDAAIDQGSGWPKNPDGTYTVGHRPTNSDGYRIMAPKLLFDYKREGVYKVGYYQLRDERTETALVNREMHFGLYTASGVIKPEGQAMQRMLLRIKDVPTSGGAVRLSVTGTGVYNWPSLRSNGVIDLALWQRKNITKWDSPGVISMLTVPSVTATVRFGTRMQLESYEPSSLDSSVVNLGIVEAGVSKTVQVGSELVMLRATPV